MGGRVEAEAVLKSKGPSDVLGQMNARAEVKRLHVLAHTAQTKLEEVEALLAARHTAHAKEAARLHPEDAALQERAAAASKDE